MLFGSFFWKNISVAEEALPSHAAVKSAFLASSKARIDLAERLFVGFGFSKILSEKLEPSQAPLPFQIPTATSDPKKNGSVLRRKARGDRDS